MITTLLILSLLVGTAALIVALLALLRVRALEGAISTMLANAATTAKRAALVGIALLIAGKIFTGEKSNEPMAKNR